MAEMSKTAGPGKNMGMRSSSKGALMKNYKPNASAVSASQDIPDPIYEHKDPITVSCKQRKDEGSMLSVVKGTVKKDPFFFSLKLNGPGLKIEGGSPKKMKGSPSKSAVSGGGSFNAGHDSAVISSLKKQPDPISNSIQERKNDGSYLSVIKTRARMDLEEITEFKIQGPGISSG